MITVISYRGLYYLLDNDGYILHSAETETEMIDYCKAQLAHAYYSGLVLRDYTNSKGISYDGIAGKFKSMLYVAALLKDLEE